jgi:hypothetical protein
MIVRFSLYDAFFPRQPNNYRTFFLNCVASRPSGTLLLTIAVYDLTSASAFGQCLLKRQIHHAPNSVGDYMPTRAAQEVQERTEKKI